MGNRWLKSITTSGNTAQVSVPSGYRTTKAWVPTIGDIVPNFTCQSTTGELDLFDFAEGEWTYLLNQPNAGGAVCSTEVASIAVAIEAFSARNCQVLCVTQETVQDQARWIRDLEQHFNLQVWFPMVADPGFEISNLFGMTHWRQDKTRAVRKTVLIDPSLRIRVIHEYPLNIGRSVEEMLRILDAQQHHRANGVATPCDWQLGEPSLVPNAIGDQQARDKFGSRLEFVAPGVRMVNVAE